jgi:hypothetical protein
MKSSQLGGGGSVQLGSYALFSGNRPNSLTLPDGKVFLKAGVIAAAAAFPTVPAAHTGYLHPLAQVSEIGSGGSYCAVVIDPGLGMPLILSDTGQGAIVQMNAAQPARTFDSVVVNGSSPNLVGSGMPGVRFKAAIVHKGRIAFGNDPSLSAYGGSTTIWSYPQTPGSWATINTNATNCPANNRVVAFASNPAGNMVAIGGANGNAAWYASDASLAATAVALPAAALWTGAAYGVSAGMFVAVASGTTGAASSPDGVTWTARTMPSASNWSAVAASSTGGLFVAVASGGTAAAYSANGTNWTAAALPAAASWSAVAHNGVQWVAIARNSSVAATSPDGITWTQRALPAVAGWADVKWCATLGVWVAVADDGRAAATYSADGITWTAKDLPRVIDFTDLIGTGTNTVYAVAAYPSVPLIAKSTDAGASWTYYRPNIKVGYSSSAPETPIRYLNGALVCVSGNDSGSIYVWRSTDGITWTQTTPAVPYEIRQPRDIAWNGAAYVLVHAYTASNAEHTYCATSPDLVTWTNRSFSGSSACQWYSVIAVGSTFYALGATGFPAFYLSKSTNNGATWSQVTQNSSTQAVNPGTGCLYYDAGRGAVSVLHTNPAWTLISFDGFVTSNYLTSFHSSPYSGNAGAFFMAGSGGQWVAVNGGSIEVSPQKLGVVNSSLLTYSYTSGFTLKGNHGKNTSWAQNPLPVDIGGTKHFIDGNRLLKLDTQLYIDNTRAASEGSSYTTYGQLNYYMRVK